MDLKIFVKNVYIFHQHIKFTFYGSFHNSHEILTNWLMNVDNFVQRQSALLNISMSRDRNGARGRTEIWVQMQVSSFSLLNQKPTGKNKTIISNGIPQTAT